ncbi:MAG: HPP family protein [Phycisphaerales bacterium JB039]
MQTSAATTIEEIMTREPVCVDPNTTILQLARIFEDYEISSAPVIDGEGRLIGIATKTALIRRCAEGTGNTPPAYLFEILAEQGGEDTEVIPETLITVDDFMNEEPLTARAGERVSDVAARMIEARSHRVTVIDKERFPIGIVTSLDLLRLL